jgi:hypothetical protein
MYKCLHISDSCIVPDDIGIAIPRFFLLGGLIDLFGFSMNHPAIGVIPFISWFTTPTNCHCHIYIYHIDPDYDINQLFGESLYIRSSAKIF